MKYLKMIHTLLIIGHTTNDVYARACVVNRSINWLKTHKISNPSDEQITIKIRCKSTSSANIIVDHDKIIDLNDISMWFNDYYTTTIEQIKFTMNNVIELKHNGSGIFVETNLKDPQLDDMVNLKEYFLFTVSYGGNGIKFPMILSENGKRVMSC